MKLKSFLELRKKGTHVKVIYTLTDEGFLVHLICFVRVRDNHFQIYSPWVRCFRLNFN